MAISHFFVPTYLKSINRVRMYYNVVNINDVYSANSYHLKKSFLQQILVHKKKKHIYVANKTSCHPKIFYSMEETINMYIFHHRNFKIPSYLRSRITKNTDNLSERWGWFCSSEKYFLFKHIKHDTPHRHLKKITPI